MSKLIETRPPSGFRDYPPALMIPRERVLETARRVYRSYGFVPIDTPAAESLDVLLGKGGDESDKLVYRVRGAKSETEEMGLRFDLTVPFARFAARHVPESGVPFKRYAMGPVWRGERPGQGRYREFWQCDFDTIGTTSNAADIEAVLVINDLFEALDISGFELRVNNRLVLNGVLEELGVANKSVHVLRTIDKLPKIGREAVRVELIGFAVNEADTIAVEIRKSLERTCNGASVGKQLVIDMAAKTLENIAATTGIAKLTSLMSQATKWLQNHISKQWATESFLTGIESEFRETFVGVPEVAADSILDVMTFSGDNRDTLAFIRGKFGTNPKAELGCVKLNELLDAVKQSGVPGGRIKIDLSIARGLDYYTGTIYETFLTDLPQIGSVCSGGRYDNLASLYTKQVLPGVGASLGVDRLLAAMEELKHPWLAGRSTTADVLVVQFDAARLGDYQRVARELRAAGVAVEVYPEAKKLGPQFQYAEKRGHRLALIAGPEEFEKGVWKVKDLAKREEVAVPAAEVAERIKATLKQKPN